MLVIAGDGAERAPLERAMRPAKLETTCGSSVRQRERPRRGCCRTACFVVTPSRTWEAFGLVVLESYAAGRGVITTMLPGMMDLVEPEQTGLLVPPESPAALAQAIDTLLADGGLARRFGERVAPRGAEFRLANDRRAPSGTLSAPDCGSIATHRGLSGLHKTLGNCHAMRPQAIRAPRRAGRETLPANPARAANIRRPTAGRPPRCRRARPVPGECSGR